MKKIIKAFGALEHTKAAEDDSGRVYISGYASTIAKDRAGDIISPDAWSKGGTANYLKNPILLFNHNYNKPVGKVEAFRADGGGLYIEKAYISGGADEISKLVQDEVLNAFSVSFMLKDADYISETDTFLIKDLELMEISVVSVPCNQDAIFSVAKSFDNNEEYKTFVKQFKNAESDSATSADANEAEKSEASSAADAHNKELEMTEEELKQALKEAADAAAAATIASINKSAADEAAKKAAEVAEDARITAKVTTGAEKLLADIEKRFADKNDSLEKLVGELKEELTSKSQEIDKIRSNKRVFGTSSTGDWKKEFEGEVVDDFILGLATQRKWATSKTPALMEKVNTFSGVAVSSADFEQLVSTTIERDIQEQLVLAPLFRELPMRSASMILPIMPDSGYAEFLATATTTATAPKGNLDMRSAAYGANAGVTMGERTISTKKLMSLSYLGNETEEDAIIPILGLLREAMIRSHARSVEQSILLGNNAQGVYTSGIYDGLATMAAQATTNLNQGATGFAASDVVTAAQLFTLRKAMGKYGLDPKKVVYIVSQDAYYNLIEDAEFQDLNLVGNLSTKVNGSIGEVYGSAVIVCPEFPTKAAAKFNAVAVNAENYLIPRLRGMTFETQYEAANQRNVLVATQRLGFVDVIENAASVASYQYKLA